MSGSQQLLLGGAPQVTPVDPFFYSVTSLLHGDGTNGAQNNTFLDSSTNNFTITRNGNTTQGSFSPFSQTGWSNYFDGTGDELSVASNAAFNLSSGAWTVEAWIYPTTSAGYRTIISGRSAIWEMGLNTGTYQLYFYNGSLYTTTATVTPNAWNHVALSSNGTDIKMYINGVLDRTVTASPGSTATAVYIGSANTVQYFTGYIADARIVKGTQVYPSAFTPPTAPLTAITNTSLLTCQANRFLDASSNAFAITANGNVSVQPFSPFNPTTAYSTSTVGGSGYFDGSGDYLVTPSNANLSSTLLGSDFTIECWLYLTSYPSGGAPIWTNSVSNSDGFSSAYVTSTGTIGTGKVGTNEFVTTATVVLNAWNHFATVRNGATVYTYLNGAQAASGAASTYLNTSATKPIQIAQSNQSSPANLTGYISGYRISTAAQYTGSTYTIPTAPPTAISGTNLLLNFTNAGIFDNAADADYETVGNAQISTSVKKYGTGSMAFDGTGDWVYNSGSSPILTNISGTADFTIEFWVYFNSVSNNPQVVSGYSGSVLNWAFYMGSAGNLAYYLSSNGSTWNIASGVSFGTTMTTGVWYHIAFVRVGSKFIPYVNGNAGTATTSSASIYFNNQGFQIGGISGFVLNGYIDDLRISKGIARYPYNFTPPTAEFPNIGGTVTLTADPYFEYTTLLLPGNGTNGAQNNTFLDSSTNNFTITRNGNTTQGTFSPFSQTGWGNYFDGTGDFLEAASSTAFDIGTGDFTVEAFIYVTDISATRYVVNRYQSFTGGRVFSLGLNSGGYAAFGIYNYATQNLPAGYKEVASATAVTTNSWNHIAGVRSGDNLYIFVNGTLQATTTGVSAFDAYGTSPLQVGAYNYSGTTLFPFLGYISNARIVKGTAVYTANFTPSTTPLTAITNTSLLTCQSNRFVDNSSNAFAITRNGDVSVQSFSPFNPTAAWSAATYGGSGYFDGSGDYLNGPSTGQFAPTGDFTISMWIYPTSFAASFYVLAGSWAGAGAANEWLIQYDNTGAIRFLTTTDSTFSAAGVIKLNQWQFLSISRTGSTLTGYVNGTSFRSYTLTGTVGSATKVVYIGIQSGTIWPYIGYMADFRMVAGSAESATPPASPATAISGTNMLLNFTNAGIYDATSKNDLETVGNAQISTTQSKFGGSSMYFDGTGDWLRAPSGPITSLEGDFTAEGWVYLSSTAAAWPVFTVGDSNGSTGIELYRATSNGKWRVYSNNTAQIDSTTSTGTGSWVHLAVTRYSGVVRLFINGINEGSTWSTTGTFSGAVYVGAEFYGGSVTVAANGYIQDLRITKGIARYTSNFTPPTTAFLTL
jgi:hypothetical protein